MVINAKVSSFLLSSYSYMIAIAQRKIRGGEKSLFSVPLKPEETGVVPHGYEVTALPGGAGVSSAKA